MPELRSEHQRTEELLDKLEQRALSCRGLFPVTTRLEFLNLASDQQLGRFLETSNLASLSSGDLQKLSLNLERFWRDPSLCPQQLAQALLRHQKIILKSHRCGEASHDWPGVIHSALSQAAETACQPEKLKTA